jgi:hypothetical protein
LGFGEGENLFSREKKFSPFPRTICPCREQRVFIKIALFQDFAKPQRRYTVFFLKIIENKRLQPSATVYPLQKTAKGEKSTASSRRKKFLLDARSSF